MKVSQNRIDKCFFELEKQNKKALITFVTAADPDFSSTLELIVAMDNAGADIIELGIPFSDPMAEGPVIQAANERALSKQFTMNALMDFVVQARKYTQKPLVFLCYFNTVLHYGIEEFIKKCNEIGIDGVIIPDLPKEESEEIAPFAKKYNVYHISMIAPTSGERVARIASQSQGFLYCVSSLGVTGVRNEFHAQINTFMADAKKYSSSPVCVGFGISSPQQVVALKPICDGVIVGSAIVKIVGNEKLDQKQKCNEVAALVGSLRSALDS